MKVLIYTFEKFGELKNNPVHDVGVLLKESLPQANVIQLSVTFHCWKILEEAIKKYEPDFVLGLGAAEKYSQCSVEKVALNYMHNKTTTTDGETKNQEKIQEESEIAQETSLNPKVFVQALMGENIPSRVSFHAGTYVCNYAYYYCLTHAKEEKFKTIFIHIPTITSEENTALKFDAQKTAKALCSVFTDSENLQQLQ